MLPRKTGPAPIFNYRKRPRQAVVADPESQTPNTQEPPSHRISQPPPPPPPQPISSYASNTTSRPMSFAAATRGRGCGRGTTPVGPRPTVTPPRVQGPIRPPGASVARSSSLPGQPMVQGNLWRGVDSRQGNKATALNQDWKAAGPSLPSGPSAATGSRRQQPAQYQRPSRPSTGGGGGGFGGGSGGGGNISVPSLPQHNAQLPPKQKATGRDEKTRSDGKASTDKSLRVLTLPVAHVKRAFGVLNDTVSAFLFCLFGIVDSATVSDTVTSGKSFALRDESGRITCIFCEIDRQMPRLHRGQWYRAVGVARPSWQALQCLSLRPVSQEERQAARAVASLSVAQLNDICLNVTEM